MNDIQKYDLTEEQIDNIVAIVMERILNAMPKVIGNLMQQQATANKIKKDYYEKYPEFEKHKEIVAAVVQKFEGENLTTTLDIIMERATPVIKERIRVKESLDLSTIKKVEDINKVVLPETEIKLINENDNENNNGAL